MTNTLHVRKSTSRASVKHKQAYEESLLIKKAETKMNRKKSNLNKIQPMLEEEEKFLERLKKTVSTRIGCYKKRTHRELESAHGDQN